jgi:hypothetical protein
MTFFRQPFAGCSEKTNRGAWLIDMNNYFIEFQLVEHVDKTGHPRL